MQYVGKSWRNELKYYLHPHQYLILRTRVRALLQQDKHSITGDGYQIRSLYFDTINNDALFEKNYGVHTRKKYRIRIYNGQDRIIKLERKNKMGEFINKESASLSRQEYNQIMAGDWKFLLERQDPLLKQFYYGVTVHGLKPKVIVDYTREAYTYPLGDVRITFDKGLATVINTLNIFDTHAVPVYVFREPREILEIKYTQLLPVFIKELLDFQSSLRSSVSKYVLCREFMKNHHHHHI